VTEHHTDEVDAVALRDEYEPALERALDRLPVPYRQLLQLLNSDASPSYEETAKAMGLPLGSVGPMRLRALQMLRRDPGLRTHADVRKPVSAPDGSSFQPQSS
jgi:DNA-directed RNA polymerase specialized sigma24 family protein